MKKRETFAKKARQNRNARAIERMDQPMRDERVEARIREHDVQPPAGRGVAFERRPQVGEDVLERLPICNSLTRRNGLDGEFSGCRTFDDARRRRPRGRCRRRCSPCPRCVLALTPTQLGVDGEAGRDVLAHLLR